MKKSIRFTIFFFIFINCILFVNAVDRVVNQSAACAAGAAYYSTISAAITASGTGDTIYVCPGTYPGDLIVNKRLNLIGYGDKSQIVINGTGKVVSITANNVLMSNFTIANATTTAGNKIGLNISGTNNSIFENIDIKNIKAIHNYNGYGLYMNKAYNNTFRGTGKISSIQGRKDDAAGVAAFGIYLSKSFNNNISGFQSVYNITGADSYAVAYGIYLTSSKDNFFSIDSIKNITTYVKSAWGIYFTNSSNNIISSNNLDIEYIKGRLQYDSAYGISLNFNSDNNYIGTIGYIKGIYDSCGLGGIDIDSSDNNLIEGNGNSYIDILDGPNNAVDSCLANGIYMYNSNYNNVTGFDSITNMHSSGAYSVAGGIYLDSSDHNYISGLSLIENMSSNRPRGIILYDSSNNSIIGNDLVISRITAGQQTNNYGILLRRSSSQNKITGIDTISYLNSPIGGSAGTAGILIGYHPDTQAYPCNNNLITGNGDSVCNRDKGGKIFNLTGGGYESSRVSGIMIEFSDYNNITGFNLITNITSKGGLYSQSSGIYLLTGADRNIISDPTISNIIGAYLNAQFRYLFLTNTYNTISATFTPNPTHVWFKQHYFMYINGESAPVADPVGSINISKYVKIEDYTAGTSWIFLNVSYSALDLYSHDVNESSLEIWKKPAGAWTQNTGTATKGVNTAQNYVYANISNFGSTFAPLGDQGYDGDSSTDIVFSSIFTTGDGTDCNDDMTIYANYSDINGDLIPGASCNISFSAAPTGPLQMTENANNYSYTRTASWGTNGTHTYDVTCAKTGYIIQTDFTCITFDTCEGKDPANLIINGTGGCCNVSNLFKANYTDASNGSLIVGANCNITFDNNGTFYTMNESADYYYWYQEFICNATPQNSAFNHTYNITCSHPDYLENQSNSIFNITQGTVNNVTCDGAPSEEGDIATNLTVITVSLCCEGPIDVKANYTNSTGTHISGAACNVTFDDNATIFILSDQGAYYYNSTKEYSCEGQETGAYVHYYNVTCSKEGYELQKDNSTFIIYVGPYNFTIDCPGGTSGEDVIPEFNIIGIILILIIAIVGYITISRKTEQPKRRRK